MSIVTHLGVVYPWLCDSMGHMNTQHYAAMYDAATFHFLNALAPQQALADLGRGWADIKQTIEYKHEARSGGLVTIHTCPLRVGGKSVSFLHEMRNSETDAVHSTCENVTVLFDLKARKAIPLDEAIRAAAKRLGLPET
jgi:acyl-CoA thioester hydrolase